VKTVGIVRVPFIKRKPTVGKEEFKKSCAK